MKFLLIANTSKYLYHYRKLLIVRLNEKFKEVVLFCPKDESSDELKNIARFRNWALSNSNEFNFFKLVYSLYRLLCFIKSEKPEIIHSHTLKPNVLVSIVNFIFGINTVISFAGLGRLSIKQGLTNFLLKLILRIIYQFSKYEIKNLIFLRRNNSRVKFIFQNPIDMKFFIDVVNAEENYKNFYLIPGSGVPNKYFKSIKKNKNNGNNNFDFIYCARLVKSKGIMLFIELSFLYPESNFFVYGDFSSNSKDNLTHDEIIKIKKKTHNIIFMGYVRDPLLKHHNDKTIFVIPSGYGEGLPRGILEAMSLQIPVIANKKSCVGLFDNKTLFMVPENNLNSYKKRLNSS